MKKENLIIWVVMSLVVSASLGFSIFNYFEDRGYEEVCIAEQCSKWAVGEDWIKDNCHLDENNQYDYCDVKIEGQEYKVALEDIDLTKARSCSKSECFTKIRVLQINGGK